MSDAADINQTGKVVPPPRTRSLLRPLSNYYFIVIRRYFFELLFCRFLDTYFIECVSISFRHLSCVYVQNCIIFFYLKRFTFYVNNILCVCEKKTRFYFFYKQYISTAENINRDSKSW